MGLHQRSQKITFRFPEAVLLLLLVITLSAAWLWWTQAAVAGRIKRPAYITGISLRKDAGADLERKDLIVRFSYYVDGVEYKGQTESWRVQQTLYHTLPAELKARLREAGFFSIEELPPEIQGVLAKKGIISFDHIPDTAFQTMVQKGCDSPDQIPEEMRTAIRNRDYAVLANAIDTAIPDAAPEAMEKVIRGQDHEVIRQNRSGEISLPEFFGLSKGALFEVTCHPRSPEVYAIASYLSLSPRIYLAFFLAGVLFSLVYCVALYPRLKEAFR
jgi:hypothetical protein